MGSGYDEGPRLGCDAGGLGGLVVEHGGGIVSGNVLRLGVFAVGVGLATTMVAAPAAASCESDFEDLLVEQEPFVRHEAPEDGFAVSFPEGWLVRAVEPALERTDGLRLEALLTADPPDEGSTCTVYAATDAAPWPDGTFPGDDDHVFDDPAWTRADALMRPLMEELGYPAGFGIGYTSLPGPVGISFREPEGSLFVGYHLPGAEGDFVLACRLYPWGPQGERSVVGWPCDPHAATWSVLPIAESFEVQPAEE